MFDTPCNLVACNDRYVTAKVSSGRMITWPKIFVVRFIFLGAVTVYGDTILMAKILLRRL